MKKLKPIGIDDNLLITKMDKWAKKQKEADKAIVVLDAVLKGFDEQGKFIGYTDKQTQKRNPKRKPTQQ